MVLVLDLIYFGLSCDLDYSASQNMNYLHK